MDIKDCLKELEEAIDVIAFIRSSWTKAEKEMRKKISEGRTYGTAAGYKKPRISTGEACVLRVHTERFPDRSNPYRLAEPGEGKSLRN